MMGEGELEEVVRALEGVEVRHCAVPITSTPIPITSTISSTVTRTVAVARTVVDIPRHGRRRPRRHPPTGITEHIHRSIERAWFCGFGLWTCRSRRVPTRIWEGVVRDGGGLGGGGGVGCGFAAVASARGGGGIGGWGGKVGREPEVVEVGGDGGCDEGVDDVG